MKKFRIKTISTLLLATLFLAACSDSEEDTPLANSGSNNADQGIVETEIVASNEDNFKSLIATDTLKLWEATAFTLAGQTAFTSCRLDDAFIFNADGTYQYDGGNNLCGAEDTRTTRIGTWKSDFQAKTIIFDEGTRNEVKADVIGLNATSFSLSGTYRGMEVRGSYESK